MTGVIVYTMRYCPFCEQAKALLRLRSVHFQEILVSLDDDATWTALYKKSGLRTMPQIFKGEKLIGGFSDLAQLDAKDLLASLK
jgi:glutaredoxin 3